MNDQADPCVPDSKLSFKTRAVLYEMWNYDVPHGYSESARWGTGRDYDEMLNAEADRLYKAWDAHLKAHKGPGVKRPMALVCAVYDTREGAEAVATYHEEAQ